MKRVVSLCLSILLLVSLSFSVPPHIGQAQETEEIVLDYTFENDWGEWGLPSIEPDTDVGPIAVAPDGTIFAAILEDGEWMVQKSEDDGYTWDDTELDDAVDAIVDIAVSPNYDDDETLYVGCADGTVYRLEEAGDGDVITLKEIVDSEGTEASELFSMDVWTHEDGYNWILVGTDLDVLALKDKTFEDWRDQELNEVAYEVAFSPDFDDSELIWAVAVEDSGDFLVTSTVSPGQWGQDIGEVDIPVMATSLADIDFPDDYDSDPDSGNTNLWLAVSDGAGGGDIFVIEGIDADDGLSNAIAMFTDIGGESATDFISIAVSGDYGDEIILAGEKDSPTVWISDDGGYGWSGADKSPTGDEKTHVLMEADVVWGGEVFDTDDGMAFASTWGDESAVSRANDGGLVYNQVGLIDTELDAILDLGFYPDFPDTATYMMLTDDGAGAYSLWLTENGDSDEPDYVRVLCGYDGGAPGNFNALSLSLVEYAQDADAIYIFGDYYTGSVYAYSIWKSTNGGQTFGKRRSVKEDAYINDWVITKGDTIYAATSAGFAMTTNSGLSWSSYKVGTATNDICLSPDFENDETILLGSTDGEVFISESGGDSFDDTGAALTGDVFVAFDPDYADEDSNGFKLIYACDRSGSNALLVGEEDSDDTSWNPLGDDTNETPITGRFDGLVISSDRALYAGYDEVHYDADGTADDWSDTTNNGLVRLLLDESDSLWENAGGLTDVHLLWLTPGSNVLWTIDDYAAELWVLEDTTHIGVSSLHTRLIAVMAPSFQTIGDLPNSAKIVANYGVEELQWMETALVASGITSSWPVFIPSSEWFTALLTGVVDAVLVGEHPSVDLQEAISSGEVRLLPWSVAAVEAVTQAYPETTMSTYLPSNTYEGQSENILGYAPTVSPAFVNIDPQSQTVPAGDSFTIDVMVDASTYDLKGCEVVVSYDSSAMTTSEAQVTGNNLLGGFEIGPTVADGEVSYALASATAVPGVSGSMMTIEFTIDEAATIGSTYDLTISAELRDENNDLIPGVTTNDGTVTIGKKGDFDGDGDVDLADFVEFVAAYGSSTGDANYKVAGDFDDDGDIDLADFVAFVAVYGT